MKDFFDRFWWLILLIFLLGGGEELIPVLIALFVLGIVFSAVRSSQKQDRANPGRRAGRSAYRSETVNKYPPSELARINVYLRRYFQTHQSLAVTDDSELRLHGNAYTSLSGLDFWRNGAYVCGFDDFAKRYPDSYDTILRELWKRSSQPQSDDVIDVEATIHKEEPKEEKKPAKEEKPILRSQYYIDELTRLNVNIPDRQISDGLDQTVAELRQIHDLEEKFPESQGKLKKLYEYYLPILVRILKQYESLQGITTDPSYEDTYNKLNRTIGLINDAMKTIISSMTDQDFINLSADISTLEAVLQKDGFTSDMDLNKQDSEEKKQEN